MPSQDLIPLLHETKIIEDINNSEYILYPYLKKYLKQKTVVFIREKQQVVQIMER